MGNEFCLHNSSPRQDGQRQARPGWIALNGGMAAHQHNSRPASIPHSNGTPQPAQRSELCAAGLSAVVTIPGVTP